MANKKDRPPIPGGYPDTKIDGPAVERTGLLIETAEPDTESADEAADETPAEEK